MSLPDGVLVVGGGLAGTGAAIALAGAGRKVTVLEKEAGPHHKVCGEFLSGEAVAYLRALDIDPPGLGAVPIRRVRFAGTSGMAEVTLPFPAWSLSRLRLDAALLERAAQVGVDIRLGERVEQLARAGEGWSLRLRKGDPLAGRSIFLASGKHDLRGWKRPPGRQNDLVAFKMHWRLTPEQHAALGDAVELISFRGGYGGLEPIEGGVANLCLLVRRERLQAVGGAWNDLLPLLCAQSRHLRTRLDGGQALWNAPLAISAIPYGMVQPISGGLWRLGDQAAVIPSFSGDGMSIALHSAALAASCYLAGGSPEDFQAELAAQLRRQVARATIISRLLVSAWGQASCGVVARLLPGVMTAIARATRIDQAVRAA